MTADTDQIQIAGILPYPDTDIQMCLYLVPALPWLAALGDWGFSSKEWAAHLRRDAAHLGGTEPVASAVVIATRKTDAPLAALLYCGRL